MRLTLDLPTDVSIALRRAAAEHDSRAEETALLALRDWLTAHGHIEMERDLEDMEPEGSA